MLLEKLEREVPFDQFSRQYQVTEILTTLKGRGGKLKIVDVGGYKGRTQDFLIDEDVTVVDLYDVEESNYIKGSALDLPFDDASFDFVLSFDVLEHIPQLERERFVAECHRVARRGVIICAPNKTPLNVTTEIKLNDLYQRLHKTDHQWLHEHIEYGIPDFDKLEKSLKNKSLATVRFFSNKTRLWFMMQQAIFLNSKFPIAAEELLKLNLFYNVNFKYDGGGTNMSSYRQIICGLRQKSDADKLSKALSNINDVIDPMLELELIDKINNYITTLTSKTSQLASNYQELYEHEQVRAGKLENINQKLSAKLNAYKKILPVKTINKTRSAIKKRNKE